VDLRHGAQRRGGDKREQGDGVEADRGGAHAAEDGEAGGRQGVERAAGDDGVGRGAERGVGRGLKRHFVEKLVGEREAAEAGVGGEQRGEEVGVGSREQAALRGEGVYLGYAGREGQRGAGDGRGRQRQGVRRWRRVAVA
jgi:hypothetical protein